MSRTTVGYFLMAVCAGGILWAILKFGSGLEAMPDLSGRYRIVQPSELSSPEAEIQQSGQFVHLRLGKERPTAYKLERHTDFLVLRGDQDSRQVYVDHGPSWASLKLIDPTGQRPKLQLFRDNDSPAHAAR